MKKTFVITVLILMLFSVVSAQRLAPRESTRFINIVSEGSFNNFPDTSIGEAFESYFEAPRWRYYREGSEDIVEFTGNFTDENGEKASVTMKFYVNESDETFVLQFWAINGTPQDNSDQYNFLLKIFVPDRSSRALSVVREGYFYDYPESLIGESFANFFSDGYWDYFVTFDDEDVVEFTGSFYLDGQLVEALFQFLVYLEDRTFETVYLEVAGESKDADYLAFILDSIFASQISIVKNSYFDTYYYWMTLGEAFDGFFTDPYWNYFLSTENQEIVEFFGTFDLGGVPAEVYVQFEIVDGDYYLYYWEMDEYPESINSFYLLLELIYK